MGRSWGTWGGDLPHGISKTEGRLEVGSRLSRESKGKPQRWCGGSRGSQGDHRGEDTPKWLTGWKTAPPKCTFPFKLPSSRSREGRDSRPLLGRTPQGQALPGPGKEGRGSRYSSLRDGPGELGSGSPGAAELRLPVPLLVLRKQNINRIPGPPHPTPNPRSGRDAARRGGRGGEYKRRRL